MYVFWNNLFKKKSEKGNNFNASIANNFYTIMPSFEELTIEEQEFINNLKKEYLSLFETCDDYINLDKELFNEVEMYLALVLDIMLKDNFGDILSSMIDSKKLIYFAHRFKEINNILKYKYIALNEIIKDKKYLTKYTGLYVLGKRKINIFKALDYQIDIINRSCLITNQKIYEYSAKAIANYPKNISENIKNELEKRYNEVEKDYNDLFNSSLDFNNNLEIVDKITYMEIHIDKFIYDNKDMLNRLKEHLEIIAHSEIQNKNCHQEMINNLMIIKMYYNIFNKYGRNTLTKEDFEELYQIIFNVYTCMPFNNGFIKYCQNKASDEELKIYNKNLQKKLEMFLLKKSKIFRTSIINDKVYNFLLDIFNSSQVEFCQRKDLPKNKLISDSFDIKKFEDLDFLLALDYSNGFDLYFNEQLKYGWNVLDIAISEQTTKIEFYKYITGLVTNELKEYSPFKAKPTAKILNDQKLFYLLYKNKINFNILPFLSDNCNLSKFIYYRNKCCKSKTYTIHNIMDTYVPSKTKFLSINICEERENTYSENTYLNKIYLNNDLEKMLIIIDILNFSYKENTLLILPETNNMLNINFDIILSCVSDNLQFLTQIYDVILQRICSAIVLPKQIFDMDDNNENNMIIFDYIYNLFYDIFQSLNQIKLVDYYFVFTNMFNRLIILEKNNVLYNVNDYLWLARKDSLQCENKKDILKSYETALNDYIINLNKCKKDLKLQFSSVGKEIDKLVKSKS